MICFSFKCIIAHNYSFYECYESWWNFSLSILFFVFWTVKFCRYKREKTGWGSKEAVFLYFCFFEIFLWMLFSGILKFFLEFFFSFLNTRETKWGGIKIVWLNQLFEAWKKERHTHGERGYQTWPLLFKSPLHEKGKSYLSLVSTTQRLGSCGVVLTRENGFSFFMQSDLK